MYICVARRLYGYGSTPSVAFVGSRDVLVAVATTTAMPAHGSMVTYVLATSASWCLRLQCKHPHTYTSFIAFCVPLSTGSVPHHQVGRFLYSYRVQSGHPRAYGWENTVRRARVPGPQSLRWRFRRLPALDESRHRHRMAIQYCGRTRWSDAQTKVALRHSLHRHRSHPRSEHHMRNHWPGKHFLVFLFGFSAESAKWPVARVLQYAFVCLLDAASDKRAVTVFR